MIVGEDGRSALALDFVVQGMSTPADQRFLIAPDRQRNQPAGAGQAFVAFVGDETIDREQLGRGFTSKMTANMG
jgi:hypothetical protein